VGLYLVAFAWPPLALLWCRKPGQALLNLLLLLGLAVAASMKVLPDPLLAVAAIMAILWPIGVVAERRAPGRAARRIREAWGGGQAERT
jgi:hypothetical protein